MKITENYKIRGLNPETSRKVQEICIAQGIVWRKEPQRIRPEYTILFISANLSRGDDSYIESGYFDCHPNTEITPEEFINRFGEEKETNALRELLVKADSAMQNKEWDDAYCLCVTAANVKGIDCGVQRRARCAKGKINREEYKEAHELILDMLSDTYPPEDRIRTKCVQQQYKSNCCDADIKTEGSPDFIGDRHDVTMCYICTKCEKPCDPKLSTK